MTTMAAASSPAWAFDPLPPLAFDVIMADPPWLYELHSAKGEERAPQAHYACLSTAAIAALPVSHLARGDAWLWLWTTFPMLARGDAHQVLDEWGFRTVTGGVWVKRGPTGKLAIGAGYVLRGNAEPFLIGAIGNPKTRSRSVRNVIEAPRGRHSEKPDEAYRAAETLFGPARRADLFSRRSRPGWEGWGYEARKFDGVGDGRVPSSVSCPACVPASPINVATAGLSPGRVDLDERSPVFPF